MTTMRRMKKSPEAIALGLRVKEARKKMHLSQEALGKLVGCKQQTICEVEKGWIQRSGRIVKLAQVLEIDPGYLQFGIKNRRSTPQKGLLPIDIPVVDLKIFALNPEEALDNPPHYMAFAHPSLTGDTFGIILTDRAMYTNNIGIINKHDIIFFTGNFVPQEEDLVIVKTYEKGILFRQYCKDINGSYLRPLNNTYASYHLSPCDTYLGKAILVVRPLSKEFSLISVR